MQSIPRQVYKAEAFVDFQMNMLLLRTVSLTEGDELKKDHDPGGRMPNQTALNYDNVIHAKFQGTNY